MIQVTVEFRIHKGMKTEFDGLLQQMQDRVKSFAGYLGEEPCQSLDDPSKFVTLFYFRDQSALEAWRNDAEHRQVQQIAKDHVFEWYRIQVAQIDRSYEGFSG